MGDECSTLGMALTIPFGTLFATRGMIYSKQGLISAIVDSMKNVREGAEATTRTSGVHSPRLSTTDLHSAQLFACGTRMLHLDTDLTDGNEHERVAVP